jgi:hypothetical protein
MPGAAGNSPEVVAMDLLLVLLRVCLLVWKLLYFLVD